jgi:hypothetical protein
MKKYGDDAQKARGEINARRILTHIAEMLRLFRARAVRSV